MEVLARCRRVALLLNLDYAELPTPVTPRAQDAMLWSFLVHATETGGVLMAVDQLEDVEAAVGLIQLAYRQVTR